VLVRERGREPGRVVGRVAAPEDGQRQAEVVLAGWMPTPGPEPALGHARRMALPAISSARSRIAASGDLLGAAGSAGGWRSVVRCRWFEQALVAQCCSGAVVAADQRSAE
jgi:hypothetical protein